MPHSLAPVGGVCARMLDCSLFKPTKKGGGRCLLWEMAKEAAARGGGGVRG